METETTKRLITHENISVFRAFLEEAKGLPGHSELWCGKLVHPDKTGVTVSKRASRLHSVCAVFIHEKVQICVQH